jgi:hypothetical protein
MDEILASIRRIIESNDPVPPGGGSMMPEPEGFSGNAANDDMEDIPLTIDETFAPRIEPERPVAPPVSPMAMEETMPPMASQSTDGGPQRALSLADVAARVRAASERNPGLRELAPRASEERTPLPPASSPLVTSRMAASGPSVPPEAARPVWDAAPAVQREPEPRAMAGSADPAMMPPAKAEAPVAAPMPIETATAVSLISAGAGEQVARSFQDLAVAVDEAERRSYEEIAADLLRPMLQEWLDENLPTLVERLVREEIERVARGNRR